ncbi:ABC-type uncharacterized transport system, periplasmic component [Erwinia amylovora MR1]|nr:ABC-type uncharacterized transport system, periplasmic component [Erwinia amylovora MR1]
MAGGHQPSQTVSPHPHRFTAMQTTLVHRGDSLTGVTIRRTVGEIPPVDLLYAGGNAQPDSVVCLP